MSKTSLFLTVCSILVFIFIAMLLSNYNLNQMEAEVHAFHIPYSLEDGCAFTLNDFYKSFDYRVFDLSNARARFFIFYYIGVRHSLWP